MNHKLLCIVTLFVSQFAVSADIFKSIESHDKKSIYKWLQSKPDLDVVHSDGQSVLIKAVQAENKYAVKQLIANGVNVNKIDKFGKTALDYAVELENRKIAKILVKAKACVTNKENAEKCEKLLRSCRGWNCFYRIFRKICLISIICFVVIGGFGVLAIFAPIIESCIHLTLCAGGVWLIAKLIDVSIKRRDLKLEALVL